MSEWQAIETAPKDGTQFLASVTGITGSRLYAIVKRRGAKWIDCADHDSWIDGCGPTHWMPLPKHPVSSK